MSCASAPAAKAATSSLPDLNPLESAVLSHGVDNGVQTVADDAIHPADTGACQEVDVLLGNGLLRHGTHRGDKSWERQPG